MLTSAALRRHPILIHLALLLTVVIWGVTFVAIRYLVVRIGAADTMLLRSGLSSLCFAAILAATWRGTPPISAAIWKRLIVIAVCGVVVNNLAITYSQNYITAALASLIVTSNPVFTAIFSRVLLGEPLTRRKLSGIALAFAGFLIVLLYGGGEATFSVDNAIGVLILICAPFGWAIYTVLSKPLLAVYEPHTIAGLTTVMGGLILSPLLLFHLDVGSAAAGLSLKGWLALLTISMLAVVLAYVLWYRALRRLEPSQTAVYMYLVPFFGVMFAWLLLDETITPYLLLGGVTILSGVIVTNSGRRPPAEPADGPQGARNEPSAELRETVPVTRA
jgi:drug/metabolite transporter (DMT)-like permease